MKYGELRSHFLEVLDRDDCTSALADRFISSGLRRVERLLRTPFQRKVSTLTVDETFPGYVVIPGDYLSIYEVRVDGVEVYRITASQKEMTNGFYIESGGIHFSPEPKEGAFVEVEYYASFDPASSDEASTTYSLIIPDLIVYASLIYASIYFVDERKPAFEQMFGSLAMEVQTMADNDELAGGLVITPYGGGIA